jgi:3-hydroxyisobutyrate dehydrogenase-like beta-hydroxyacid dehydrogenase
MRIAFLGPGNIGTGMVHRLLGEGHQVVVWARSPDKAQNLLRHGADRAPTARDAAASADLVLSCLASPDAVRDVLVRGGVLSDARPGQVFVEHGTFPPVLAQELSGLAASRGAAFLDAPVSGGPEGARTGTLTIMIGGDAKAAETVRPVLLAYGQRVVRVGPMGAGQKLKLINQVLVAIHVAAAAEAAAAVARAGLDPLASLDALKGGWAQSAMMERNMPRVFDSDYAESGATIGGFNDVLDEVDEYLRGLGVQTPVFDGVRGMFGAAAKDGHGGKDLAAIGQPLYPE